MPETIAGANELGLSCISTIRTLAIDSVQAAESGHPGTPVSRAAVGTASGNGASASTRMTRSGSRDRFVLSIGHASMLLYALLHLSRPAVRD